MDFSKNRDGNAHQPTSGSRGRKQVTAEVSLTLEQTLHAICQQQENEHDDEQDQVSNDEHDDEHDVDAQ